MNVKDVESQHQLRFARLVKSRILLLKILMKNEFDFIIENLGAAMVIVAAVLAVILVLLMRSMKAERRRA